MMLSREDFYSAQALTLNSSNSQSPDSIVTGMQLENGKYHILSRYGDTKWRLPDTIFPTSTAINYKFINFDLTPLEFREVMKKVMLQYYLEGRSGSGRPSGNTIWHKYHDGLLFLRFLADQNITKLSAVTTLTCLQYVDRTKKREKRNGEKLSNLTIHSRLSALEWLHEMSAVTNQPMVHPWPDTSSKALAGIVGKHRPSSLPARTKLIPHSDLAILFQHSTERIQNADKLFRLRKRIDDWRSEGRRDKYIGEHLSKCDWSLNRQRQEEHFLRCACFTIIFATSGLRAGELLSLKAGAKITRRDNDQTTYWVKGNSTKTKNGESTWLVTKLTHQAVEILETLSSRARARYQEHIEMLKTCAPNSPDIPMMEPKSECLLLVNVESDPKKISLPDSSKINEWLKKYAKACGTAWPVTTHQFRRTFAVYAARSSLGDLRYLREHFKHWSLDMTTLYAMDMQQDAELYDEIGYESIGLKEAIITDQLLDKKSVITGGGAEPIKVFRSANDKLNTYESRLEMAKKLSPTVHLRATGVAWCTADLGGCGGGQAVEMTRCGNDCANAIITEDHKEKWSGIYKQQLELRNLNDIGPAGQQRVERDITISKRVLIDLGASEKELDNANT